MAIYVAQPEKFAALQISENLHSLPILKRVANADKTAVKNCIDAYGNLVWALAKKYTDSPEEAETAAQEIFLDIWKYAGRCDSTRFDEAAFVFLIAKRRLIKRLRDGDL